MLKLLGIVGLALIIAGVFGSTTSVEALVLPPHIIADKEGNPLDDQGTKIEKSRFRDGIKELLDDMERHVEAEYLGANKPANLMISVHGGITTVKQGLDYIKEMTDAGNERFLKGMGDAHLYSVFVNWDASLWGSLWDDLFEVRFGYRNRLVAWPTIPFSLTDRLIRGLISAPISFGFQVDSGKVNTVVEGPLEGEEGSAGERIMNTLNSLVAFPIRTSLLPFLNGLGAGAWDMMKRRIDEMFVDETISGQGLHKGGVRIFLESMAERMSAPGKWKTKDGKELPVEITLVGHSMGAIVVNRILREFPEIQFKRVIYLGAATSIEDFRDNVIPYLALHTGTYFYGFSLPIKDENRESNYFVAPLGSLLVWIDNMFEPGVSAEQKRIGWWKNANKILVSRKKICSRMTFLKFHGNGHEWEPKKHDEFNDDKKFQRILMIATPKGSNNYDTDLCPDSDCKFYSPCEP